MDEDIRLFRLFLMLLVRPRTLTEVQLELGISRWSAIWYINRLRAILPLIPVMAQVQKERRTRTYRLVGEIFGNANSSGHTNSYSHDRNSFQVFGGVSSDGSFRRLGPD